MVGFLEPLAPFFGRSFFVYSQYTLRQLLLYSFFVVNTCCVFTHQKKYTTCVPWCITLLIDIYLLFVYQKNVAFSLNS